MTVTAGSKSPTVADLLTTVAQLSATVTEQGEMIRTAATRRITGAVVDGHPPSARRGEDIMSSRGFSMARVIGSVGKNAVVHRDQAKIELDFSDRLRRKAMQANYNFLAGGDSVLVPIWPDAFNEEVLDEGMYREMKSLLYAGVHGADEDEMQWLARKHFGSGKASPTAAAPAQSWIDQSLGGSFVAPPTFGPPIDLLRNKEAMMRAGAQVVPLGPSGRITYPRLTGATQGGWGPENAGFSPTTAQTGSLTLSAKKVIGGVVLPGELLRFSSPATEAMVRNDLMITVSLIMDKGLLDGPGSDQQPLGLLTMASAGSPSPSAGSFAASTYGVQVIGPTNANQLAPQDIYSFLMAIEENNGEATAWIMRPQMAYAFYKARWTPYSGGTSQGAFTFDMIRGMDGKPEANLAMLPVVRSTQVSKTRGSGTQTAVICLNGQDYYIGMFGAIELTQSGEGWTFLFSDQVGVRAILHCDGGMRHPAQVAVCDALNFLVAG